VFPYLAMLAVPACLTLSGVRRAGIVLLLVAALYWLMVGFRFHVGMDWNNYIYIYQARKAETFTQVLTAREPGYGFLSWVAARSGLGVLFLNAASALVFCWGLFSVARRCPDPLLAIVVATPLLVVAFAMSGTRQAIATGLIYYLFATWEKRQTASRVLIVALASLFHFSAIFIGIFVALGVKAPVPVRVFGVVVVALIFLVAVRMAPVSMDAYSRLYVGAQSKLSAPGAIAQVAPLALAGVIYLALRERWTALFGDDQLMRSLAWGALIDLPVILISSVGAYRFGLYFWPLAMYVYSGLPSLSPSATGRAFLRLSFVVISFALLIGWLMFANNSWPWLPYENWLFQPEGVGLLRPATR
jgi:hypothetical protein